jgi:glycosyltransferase involved in cell wall biosynthesis
MPTHNRARLLPRAMTSVLAQTYDNLELLVVDDASTDDTAAAVKAFRDPRVRYLRLEQSRHAAGARNAGVAAARGEYLAFLDDDDYWLVGKLDRQVAALAAAGPGAVWSLASYLRLERPEAYIGGAFYRGELDYRRGNGKGGPEWHLIATPGWLVRRSALQQVGGFDESIRSWDDWELGLRLFALAPPVHVDEPLWVQDGAPGARLMRAERARAGDLRVIMRKHGHLWAGNREVLARHWYVIGRAESLYDPAPAGRAALWQSLRCRPLAPKTWAALAMAYLGPERAQRLTALARRRQVSGT